LNKQVDIRDLGESLTLNEEVEILAGLETESPFMVDGSAFVEEPDTVEESA